MGTSHGDSQDRVETQESGLVWKRHVDQMRSRYSPESVLVPKPSPVLALPVMGSSAHTLADSPAEPQPKTVGEVPPVQVETVPSPLTVPRYPVRERHPPDRLYYWKRRRCDSVTVKYVGNNTVSVTVHVTCSPSRLFPLVYHSPLV